ncbi:MAG: ATP-grasp domain-containing protein [Planctomycetes bacterium]|nr:ATP-grasp domain-containing protein [Planctomycetota bacterium]
MDVVFGSHPLEPRQPDPAYADEFRAAVGAGLNVHVFSAESLFEEDSPVRATRWIEPQPTPRPAIYRGFMLTEDQYTRLYESLLARNVQLINNADQYALCHYLPNYFELIRLISPESVWFELSGELNVHNLRAALTTFGDDPVIVKDYVKSEKHYWREACYIPCALDFEAAEKVVRRLIELRGPALNKGIVVRRFVTLATRGATEPGLPRPVEARLFYYRGKRLFLNAYWDQAGEIPADEELAILKDTVPRIDSNFFTVDVAKTVDGAWIVMELGDGQVAGLPPGLDAPTFYKGLRNAAKA